MAIEAVLLPQPSSFSAHQTDTSQRTYFIYAQPASKNVLILFEISSSSKFFIIFNFQQKGHFLFFLYCSFEITRENTHQEKIYLTLTL